MIVEECLPASPRKPATTITPIGLLFLLVGAACSRPTVESNAASSRPSNGPEGAPKTPPRTAGAAVKVTVVGEPFGLRIEGNTVSFCDKRGGRIFDLTTSQDAPLERACRKDDEPNAACGGLALDVTVRTPNLGPSDIVEVNTKSFPLEGRVHDCATDGKLIAIVTGAEVVTIDPTKDVASLIERGGGGDHVAVGAGWIAWSLGSVVQARPVTSR